MKIETIKIYLEPLTNREYPLIREGFSNEVFVDKNGCPINPEDVNVGEYIGVNPEWGQLDYTFINIPIFIEQTLDNIGVYDNEDFEELNQLINDNIDFKSRKIGVTLEKYLTVNDYFLSGLTESQLYVVSSYNNNTPYIEGLNMAEDVSNEFTGVIEIKDESVVYVIGGQVDNNGNYVDNTGIIYETFAETRTVEDPISNTESEIPLTTFKCFTKGYRSYNSQLKANIKEERLWGVTKQPSIDNDLFVDRGDVNVFERHLRLSEIKSLEQLERYNNGFYNLIKL